MNPAFLGATRGFCYPAGKQEGREENYEKLMNVEGGRSRRKRGKGEVNKRDFVCLEIKKAS